MCARRSRTHSRSKTNLGSSKHLAPTTTFGKAQVCETDPKINPQHEWNHVYVPYCSGDVWQGTLSDAANHGQAAIVGIFSRTQDRRGCFQPMKNATVSELILTGRRPGHWNIWKLRLRIRLFSVVKGCLQARSRIFWPSHCHVRQFTQGTAPQDPHHFAAINWTENIGTYTSQTAAFKECVEKASFRSSDACPPDEITKCCNSVPYFYPFMKTPTFISENTADSYQVYVQGRCPQAMTANVQKYVLYLRSILAGSMLERVVEGSKSKQDGLFALPAWLMVWHGTIRPQRRKESAGGVRRLVF